MSLQTFSARTMAEALAQVKQRFGHDAVILHTRTYQRRDWLGLRRREMVEVTAGPDNGDRRRARGNSGHAAQRSNRDAGRAEAPREQQAGRGGLGHNSAAMAYARNSAIAPAVAQGGIQRGGQGGIQGGERAVAQAGAQPRAFLESPEVAQAMVKLVTQEVTGLRAELKELVGHVRSNGGGQGGAPSVPAELFEHYKQLIENGVAVELASDIVKAVRLQVPQGYLKNSEFVREKIAEQLEKLLPVAGPIRRSKNSGPHVVALIGPTGVGKTTTIAKLAADLQLRGGSKVGLITIDTYRIAAVDQLRRYAEIIGSPLKVVGTPEEMPVAIAAMSEMDYILIDTAGRSPSDSLKLSELRSFIDAARPDEVHLVLSTTSDPRCVDLAVASFSKVRIDKILFTKIDEAASVGVVLNVAHKVGKPLSYVTTGQDVPDDIEVVRGRKLATMILGKNQDDEGVESLKLAEARAAREANMSRSRAIPRVAVAGGVQ